jgi:hypothetical protein
MSAGSWAGDVSSMSPTPKPASFRRLACREPPEPLSTYLTRFAMWTAFPSSDYYRGSVTIM